MVLSEFAKDWERNWNSHNLDTILAHYSEDVVFRSKKAIPLVGSGEVVGKVSLRTYWQAALNLQPDLRFEVQDVFDGHNTLVILYRNHKGILATETLYFDENHKVVLAAACHQIIDE